jgi:hypothetical protein
MAGQKKVNSNVEVKKEVVETKPVETKQVKKGGKVAETTKPVPVEAKPVPVEAKPVPVEAKPVVATKKGGKVAAEPAPVAAAKKGGKATTHVPPTVSEPAPVVAAKKGGKAAAPVVAAKKGGKAEKENKPVKVNKVKAPKKVVEEDSQEDGDDDGKKHVRSFKVRLPGSESFEGRFTGLTPYQAANKALSKYYRESNELQKEVTFSICESTRNSRKCTYTYVGGRHELSTPVTYTIADGRLITKKFKNVLKKVKKVNEVASH